MTSDYNIGWLGVCICVSTYLSAAAIQKPVTTDMKHEMKIVPRRPVYLFKMGELQHPTRAEQR